jgi:hypothetical protein
LNLPWSAVAGGRWALAVTGTATTSPAAINAIATAALLTRGMKAVIRFFISPTHHPVHLTTIQLITPQTAGIYYFARHNQFIALLTTGQ